MRQSRTKYQIRSDASKQRWVRDEKKEAFWRSHIEAWKASGLSKRGYCIKNDLTQSSFNAWHREIGIRDREKIPSTNAAALLSECEGKSPFVPLRIVSDPITHEKTSSSSANEKSDPQLVEILVPGGAVIRCSDRSNPDFITELFTSLKG